MIRNCCILLCATATAFALPDGKPEQKKALEHAVEDYLSSGELPETQITATRLARDPFDTPRTVTVILPEEYAKRRPGVAVESIDRHPGLWVEHRTTTTADPVMRGFSGANLLALIDGNTLTTLWGEGGYAGDDMYGKMDAYLIERIEVVRGPTSVLYGSNNLGGVLNFITRSSRYDYTDGSIAYGGRIYTDFYGASSGVRGRAEHHGASAEWRWLLGISGADIEDVRGPDDMGILKPTSGEEMSYDVKVQHLLAEEHEIEVFLQRMERDRTHRYYRPTQTNFNDRVGTGITYRTTALGPWADEFEARFYYQYKKDTRYFPNDLRGVATTDTFVTALQASTPPGTHRLTYGISWERDLGESPDDEQFTTHTAHQSDYVKQAPDSIWDDIGAYIQDEWEVAPKWAVIAAARVDYFHFKTEVDQYYDPPGPLDPNDDRYSDDVTALTGGLGAVYRMREDVHLFGNVARGFRQFPPAFGARQQAAGVLVPNRMLDPVTALSFELGGKVRRPDWWLDVSAYRSEISNNITQAFGTFQGEEYFDFNQNGTFEPEERVLVNVSDGSAYVTGIEIEGWCHLARVWDRLPEGLSLHGGFAYNYGNDRTRDEPLRHVHPPYAVLDLRYEHPTGRWWVEFGAMIVGESDRIPSDRIASDPGMRRNPQDITSPLLRADGTLPGYTVFDLRGGYAISDRARVEVAVENLTDKKYRGLHSRMDGPGFGVRVGFTWDF